MRLRLAALSGVVACGIAYGTSDRVSIRGRVVDVFGEPVSAATAELRRERLSAATDDEGFFEVARAVETDRTVLSSTANCRQGRWYCGEGQRSRHP